MSKIMSDELWDNFSFAVRDDRTGKIGYVKIKDFFENTEIVGGEDDEEDTDLEKFRKFFKKYGIKIAKVHNKKYEYFLDFWFVGVLETDNNEGTRLYFDDNGNFIKIVEGM